MPDRSLTLGRFSINLWSCAPTLHRLSLGWDAYTDGITAGIEINLVWCGGYLAWVWNHDNCPGCRGTDDDD
jgi:hypothetical protein